MLVDLVGVDVFGEEAFHLFQELVGFRFVAFRLFGEGMNEIEIEFAEEEIADERLARRFGDFHRLDGALGFHFSHVAAPLRSEQLHAACRLRNCDRIHYE